MEQQHMLTVQEVLPSHFLQAYIRFYQYSETRPGSAPLYKPLPARPDQCLQFSFQDPYIVIDRASGATTKAPPVVVTGRHTQRHTDLLVTGVVVTFTIHFQPAGFFRLFNIPLTELINLNPNALDVIGREVGLLHEQLCEAGSLPAMVRRVEAFLMRRLSGSQPFHPVQSAAAVMLNQHGLVNLPSLVAASNVSMRQFERTFSEQIGVPPKLFSRLARFAHALELKYSRQHCSWTEIAHEVGYYDQMHLIHDCKAFTNETPSTLLDSWRPCRQ
jgi:AraC-like DNA-binding protein